MRTRVVFAVLIVACLLGGRFVAARDAEGCEGLGAYRTPMLTAAERFEAVLIAKTDNMDDDTLMSLSSDDWRELADAALGFRRDLKAITPPAWVADWHALQLRRAGAVEQMMRAAATGGIVMMVGFTDTIDKIDAKLDAAEAVTERGCSRFAAFHRDWDATDGSIDGTPVATPAL